MEHKLRKFKLSNISLGLGSVAFLLLILLRFLSPISGDVGYIIFPIFLITGGIAIVLGLVSFSQNSKIKLIFRIILIAIIFTGVLLFVLNSILTNGKTKSPATIIKSNMVSMRAQAEIYYDENADSYAGVCTAEKPGLKGLLDATVTIISKKTTLNTEIDIAGDYKHVTCHDNPTAWAAEAPLINNTSLPSFSMYCVDSTGITKVTNNNLTVNDVTCS